MRTDDELDKIMANLDFKQGKPVSEVPVLAKLQAERKAQREKQVQEIDLIEPDVWQLIRQQSNNPKEIAKVNSVLRALLA